MIIHEWTDGSQAYEYHEGDKVSCTGMTNLSFSHSLSIPKGTLGVVERTEGVWITAKIYVLWDNYGTEICYHTDIKPLDETMRNAQVVPEVLGVWK